MDSGILLTKSEKIPVVLFVGSNPSNASTCDTAFHGSTKSSKVLTKWTSGIQGRVLMHINVLNKKTEGNRPLKKSEITANLEKLSETLDAIKPDYIVALGKTASTALTLLRRAHHKMPHPSGCNRLLNDKDKVDLVVQSMYRYIGGESSCPIE